MPATSAVLRDLTPDDRVEVLALNLAFEDLLSPMDDQRLDYLLERADRAQVVAADDGSFAGFVLCFTGDADYDGHHFAAFRERFGTAFYYLDRIVLSPAVQRQGLATRAYDEIEAAASAHGRMVLEVNVDPPNEASLAFHARRGYRDAGRGGEDGHRVMLMEKTLPRAGGDGHARA